MYLRTLKQQGTFYVTPFSKLRCESLEITFCCVDIRICFQCSQTAGNVLENKDCLESITNTSFTDEIRMHVEHHDDYENTRAGIDITIPMYFTINSI
jgi:hypothetical protein